MGSDAVAQAMRSQTATVMRDINVPSVFRCGMQICALKTALKTVGLERTLRWIRRRVERVELAGDVDSAIVAATERAVAVAGALYPGRALCLEQSLVLYYLLRRQGVAVKYCQGVHPHPFVSHAWIEYRGEVINGIAEQVKVFSRLPDQLP